MERHSATGIVRRWFSDRGFGFIKTDDGSADVFLHIKQLSGRDEPHVGDRVRFEVGSDKRTGLPEAQNITLIES